VPVGSKPYPNRYSGYLKHLYINTKILLEISSKNLTYTEFIEELLRKISEAAGDFWEFKLVSGTGKEGQDLLAPSTMKIVDNRFIATINTSAPYTFDYFDSDSLLLAVGFKPVISNAQAIRTIYAPTNQPDKNVRITNGSNELLDYKFRDRLVSDDDYKPLTPLVGDTDFVKTMYAHQQIDPFANAYQMTNIRNKDGRQIVRRLVLPDSSIVKLLLDDSDEEHNPKYTGIMPGIQATFTIQGIGGLRTFMMFLVRNLPEPYSHENIIFRIVDVQETVESGKWTTVITAGIIPLREHIKARFNLTSNKI
jgi:hypothetical protein